MMDVQIWVDANSQPIEFKGVKNVYYKGCAALHLMFEDSSITAFPLCNMFCWKLRGQYERVRTEAQRGEGE